MALLSGKVFTKEFIENFTGCGAELPIRWCLWEGRPIKEDYERLAILEDPILYSQGRPSKEGCGSHSAGGRYVRVCESCMRKLGLLW